MTEEVAKLSVEATERVLEAAKMRVKAAETAETAAPNLRKVRRRHCNVAQVFVRVEDEVNRALQELEVAVGATAAATCALSCDTGDKTEHERSNFDAALTILGSVTMATLEEGVHKVVDIETLWTRKEREKVFWQWSDGRGLR